jgi:hypothetical protein
MRGEIKRGESEGVQGETRGEKKRGEARRARKGPFAGPERGRSGPGAGPSWDSRSATAAGIPWKKAQSPRRTISAVVTEERASAARNRPFAFKNLVLPGAAGVVPPAVGGLLPAIGGSGGRGRGQGVGG